METKYGYKSIGSFHSDNVEDMIEVPDQLFNPHVPVDEEEVITKYARVTEFGYPQKDNFLLDKDWTFINHGAFGAASRLSWEITQRYSLYSETQPLRFIDRELFPLLVRSTRALAKLLNVSPRDLVLLPNVTHAINAVLRSCRIPENSTVYFLDIGYGSVKRILTEVCARAKANLHVQAISFPVSGTEDILAQVEASFPTDGSVSFAVFDHVTSNTGILLPIKKLIELAHARGAKVLVDGAHGLQSQNLDLRDLGADWYTSNCHKWLCGVKGTGFLYVSPEVRSETRALVISHGYGEGFNSEFIWDGTRDYSGLVAISSLLKWWEILGHDNAREYCESLLVRAVDVLKTTWGTGTHAPMSCYSHMACVEIPSSALPPSAFTTDPTDGTKKINATSEHSKMIQDALHFDGKIECPVKTLGSKCYFRISAGIYNSIQDYERLAEFVLQLTWPEEK